MFISIFARRSGLGRFDGQALYMVGSDAARFRPHEASSLGLSTVHINRSLMELRGLSLIILEKHGLTIPNLEKLEEYASFDPLYLHMDHVQKP